MRLLLRYAALVLLISACRSAALAEASALGDLALSMAPGTWARLPTNGLTDQLLRTSSPYPSGPTIFVYANGGAWDPINKKVYYLGSPHPPQGSWNSVFLIYDDATNTWSSAPLPFGGNPMEHGYDHIAVNPANGDVYYHLSGSAQEFRYRGGAWTQLPAINPIGFTNFAAAQRFFPETGRLVFIQGDQAGIWDYNPTTNTWGNAIVPAGDPQGKLAGMGAYQHFAAYSPPKQVLLFGGGGGATATFKLTAAGVLSRVAASPGIDTNGDNVEADPVTGNLIMISVGSPGQAHQTMYEYQVDANQWVNLTSTRGIQTPILFNVSHSNDWDPAAIITPISTYGVLMVVTSSGQSGNPEVWLYKHANAVATAPPTSPTSVLLR